MDKRTALSMVADRIAACEKCEELADHRKATGGLTVAGDGNPDSRVMFLGEAPGEDEAKQGRPFVGRSGRLLNGLLSACGWPREDVFVTNVVCCRPPRNREPESAEAANCRKFLELRIRLVDPEWIVCLGRVASAYLLGLDPDTSVSRLRGRVRDFGNRKVVCTWHPAYVLRQEGEAQLEAKRQMLEDLSPIISSL